MFSFPRPFATFDIETPLFRPGFMTPRPVCLQVLPRGTGEPGGYKVGLVRILLREAGAEYLEYLLKSKFDLVGHNIAYDLSCYGAHFPKLLPDIFAAYDAGRVHDTRVREKLIRIATGEMSSDPAAGQAKQTKFSLDAVVMNRYGVDISDTKHGANSPRTRYVEVDGMPVETWPDNPPFVQYAADDPFWTDRVFQDQAKVQPEYADLPLPLVQEGIVTNEEAQTRAAFAMFLMGAWGVRADGSRVERLTAEVEAAVDQANEILKDYGLLKPKTTKRRATGLKETTWHRDMKATKALVVKHFLDLDFPSGRPVVTPTGEPAVRPSVEEVLQVPRLLPSMPLSDGGDVSTAAETLELVIEQGTKHPALQALVDTASMRDILEKWVPPLRHATHFPLNAGWNELVETGRTSCFKPNLQNPPRKGGVRECFVPRPGYFYVSADYSQLELCALAQVCLDLFSFSHMAEAIRAKRDLHLLLAASTLDRTYEETKAAYDAEEEWAVEARQMSKAGNFGYPGGLGPDKFIAYARDSYGVVLDPDPVKARLKAVDIREGWRRSWPEVVQYHRWMGTKSQFGRPFTIVQHRSKRQRGDCTFTQGANSLFQGLAADGAKAAMWKIAMACYVDRTSPLFGCRLVLFLHDEFILEAPVDRAHEAAIELQRLMVAGMVEFIPDVPIKADPVVMERWYKGAKAVYGPDGRLIPWNPKEKA